VRTFFGQEGRQFFKFGRPHFWCKKIQIFEIYDVSARARKGGGLAGANILRTGGGGQFFAILCGRLLLTALNNFKAE